MVLPIPALLFAEFLWMEAMERECLSSGADARWCKLAQPLRRKDRVQASLYCLTRSPSEAGWSGSRRNLRSGTRAPSGAKATHRF